VHKRVIVDGDEAYLVRISSLIVPRNSGEVLPKRARALSWKEQARRLQKEAHVFYFVFKHPRTRWYAKSLAVCTAGYLLSPIQLIPSFIPVIGFVDDFAVLFLGAKLLKRITPPDVFAECRGLAEAAETRRKKEVRSMAATIASVVIASAWILAAVAASALMAAYVRH
jgi:uncharacterized membrane protein YkvA (DUF1232 family)